MEKQRKKHTTHNADAEAEEEHVTEIEDRLEEPVHPAKCDHAFIPLIKNLMKTNK